MGTAAVFDTQLGKLNDVADPLVVQAIETYTIVNRVERIVAQVNQNSRAFMGANPGNEKAAAQSRLRSALLVLTEEIAKVLPKIQVLLQRLAGPDKP
jgi:hypothetical protein